MTQLHYKHGEDTIITHASNREYFRVQIAGVFLKARRTVPSPNVQSKWEKKTVQGWTQTTETEAAILEEQYTNDEFYVHR